MLISYFKDNLCQLNCQLLSIRWFYFLRQFVSIMTSIIVNSMGILFEVEERHVAGTSYNKFGFILKDNLCQLRRQLLSIRWFYF